MQPQRFLINLSYMFLIFGYFTAVVESSQQKLLLILLDGFRWDYFDQPGLDLPGFTRMFEQGVTKSSFILTGGTTGNQSGSQPQDRFRIISFFTPQQKTSYMYHWPGCDVTIRNRKPTYCKPYKGVPQISDLQESIAESIQLFKQDSADLVGIYVELTDKYGHKYGPKSQKLNEIIVEVDKEIYKLMESLENDGLIDEVNIMIFSDHGMTDVSQQRLVNITGHVDMKDVDVMLDSGPNVYVWPKPDKIEKVYNDLKMMNNPHLSIYKKEEIPEEWFYKRHYRISPIVLIAEVGWYIITVSEETTGPGHLVMCSLLDIQPSPHNGTWSAVSEMLKSSGSLIESSISVLLSIVAIMIISFI
ncbi:hypothetical protein KUTeg_015232 [Tegillarca granosa]|uniref:glycerophosphocholine cholinephosphodiesterase n=1 Tax=Tegillarca granosa TaxID=220873 RepID=A0ABQ9EPI7_TEGGR|nr:hypothetical protein KUTeg_015232 [Tegillarca granosa]